MKRVIILLLLAAPLYAQEDRVIERWECWTTGGLGLAGKPAFTAVVYEGKERGRVSSGGTVSEETKFSLRGFSRYWVSGEEGAVGEIAVVFMLVIHPGGEGSYAFVDRRLDADDAYVKFEKLVCSME